MATNTGPNIPQSSSLLSYIDVLNLKSGTSGNITDLCDTRFTWARTNGTPTTTIDGITCLDINDGYQLASTANVNGAVMPQFYTQFYLLKWRTNNNTWRTLYRGSDDHYVIVESGGTRLGMYSNRNGGFFACSPQYDITSNTNWQTLIVTGAGNSVSDSVGTQTYYVNGVNVGTSSRVVCGTNYTNVFGYTTQAPGYVAIGGLIGTQLSSTEITQLHASLRSRSKGIIT